MIISLTGELRDIEDGLADIGMNNRLLSNMNSTNCAFLNPVFVTQMKYMIAKSPKQLKLLHYHSVQAFDQKTRWIYLITYTILLFAWYLTNILRNKIVYEPQAKTDFLKLVLITLGIQCSTSVSIKKNLPWHQRILICSCLVGALIKCNAFQGAIICNLNLPKKSFDINTLEQLLQSDKNITAFTVIPDLFKPNENESNVNQIQKRLYQRQTIDSVSTLQNLKMAYPTSTHAILCS